MLQQRSLSQLSHKASNILELTEQNYKILQAIAYVSP